MTNSSVIHVVVGLVFDVRGNILIAKRPQDKHCGGLWEFPGGKVESAEQPFAALQRELFEECGIVISNAESFIQIHHRYPEKNVLLDVFRVTDFQGAVTGREGQAIDWVSIYSLSDYSFPEANQSIIVRLKEVYPLSSRA